MSEPKGPVCPECGTHREPDGTPSCACTQRASDALRDARTADAAAAEDFDPLRIRPYVDLGGTARGGDGTAPADLGGTADGNSDGPASANRGAIPHADRADPGETGRGGRRDGGEVTPGGSVSAGEPAGTGPLDTATEAGTGPLDTATEAGTGPLDTATEAGTGPLDTATEAGASGLGDIGEAGSIDAEATSTGDPQPRGASERTMPLPMATPAPQDVHLFHDPAPAQAPVPGSVPPPSGNPPRRRRRATLVGAAGAVVGVLVAAGFASGLLSYDSPERAGALPDAVRESVPEKSPADTASVPSSQTASPTAPATRTTSGAGPSPSPSPSDTSATPSRPAPPTEAPTTARATGSIGPPPDTGQNKRGGQVLRPGDQGLDVTELQLRLAQLALYIGTIDGTYNNQVEEAVRRYQGARGITADEQGAYGPATRASLESETTEP